MNETTEDIYYKFDKVWEAIERIDKKLKEIDNRIDNLIDVVEGD